MLERMGRFEWGLVAILVVFAVVGAVYIIAIHG
jgi:hypothetical protein